MSETTRSGLRVRAFIVFLFLFLLSTGNVLAGQNPKGDGVVMELHHLQMTFLNHGLGMAVAGSNLIMLAELSKTPEVDSVLKHHGLKALQKGKELIQRALHGPEMMQLHERKGSQSKTSSRTMAYVHSLGKAMLAYVELLEHMHAGHPTDIEPVRALHHMHMALNHALGMAERGNDLILLGEMGMEPTEDIEDIKDGQAMIANATKLWKKLFGQPMKQLMAGKEGPQEAEVMARTHAMGTAGAKILNLLAAGI